MESGIIAKLNELSRKDILLLIKMMPVYKDTLSLLLLATDDTETFIKLLDLFAGQTIRFPTRYKLFHTIQNIHMRNYYRNLANQKDALLITARRFDVTTQRVQEVVDRFSGHGK